MFRPSAHHPHQMAHGLASLGRNGDSMLVHMSPGEVQGLQNLAMKHGGSLTRNPHTGLPEASWLNSLLPLAGGMALNYFAPEFASSYAPEIAIGTGVVDKLMGGSISDAIGAGMGMYGGIEAGQSLGKMNAAGKGLPTITAENLAKSGTDVTAQNAAAIDKVISQPVMNDVSTLSNPDLAAYQTPTTQYMAPVDSSVFAGTTAPNLYAGSAGQQFMSDPMTAAKDFYNNLGDGKISRSIAMMGGLNAISGAANAYQAEHANSGIPTADTQNEWYVPAPGQKSLWRQGKINPNVAKYGYLPQGESYYLDQGWNPGVYTKTSPGLKEGGLAGLKRFDAGGVTAINNPMPRPVATTDATTAPPPPPPPPQVTNDPQVMDDLHQYYRNQLEQSQNIPTQMNQPTPSWDATNAYLNHLSQMVAPSTGGTSGGNWTWDNSGATGATGNGPTHGGGSGSGGGMGSGYGGAGLPADMMPTSMPTNTATDTAATDPNDPLPPIKNTGQYRWPKQPGKTQQAINYLTNLRNRNPLTWAAISPINAAATYLTNADYRNSLNQSVAHPSVGIDFGTINNTDANGNPIDPSGANASHAGHVNNPTGSYVPIMDSPSAMMNAAQTGINSQSIDLGAEQLPNVTGSLDMLGPVGGDFTAAGGGDPNGLGTGHAYGGRIHAMARGGIADLAPTYAAGGKLLRGPGDGMSDSIPAVIHGNRPQRAALADGEFVVPADVVSHLGNGSTEAGSRKLYEMMDKIRHARTGNKKQGKQINPDKFIPR